MPPILNAQGLSKSFGATPLFRDIAFTVSDGDRIGLIGPNGAGKIDAAQGPRRRRGRRLRRRRIRKRARIGYVSQESTFAPGVTVREVLEAALVARPRRRSRARRHDSARPAAASACPTSPPRLQSSAEAGASASPSPRPSSPPPTFCCSTSRPTISTSPESPGSRSLLNEGSFASVIVTHDRYFLENVATEIVELNRVYADGLLRVQGSYSKFIEARAGVPGVAVAPAKSRCATASRTEVEWLRRGPKARATKAKARIDNAHELIGQLKDVTSRAQSSTAAIDFAATDRQTKRLVELNDVSIQLGERKIVEDLNFLIANGTRIGLVGPNGSGKTTLLRLLTGELAPSAGAINKAASLTHRLLQPDPRAA